MLQEKTQGRCRAPWRPGPRSGCEKKHRVVPLRSRVYYALSDRIKDKFEKLGLMLSQGWWWKARCFACGCILLLLVPDQKPFTKKWLGTSNKPGLVTSSWWLLFINCYQALLKPLLLEVYLGSEVRACWGAGAWRALPQPLRLREEEGPPVRIPTKAKVKAPRIRWVTPNNSHF